MTPEMTEGRPPYIQFDSREVGLDNEATEKHGYPIPRIADVVMITPMGSKDVYEKEWADWIVDKKRLAQEGRYDGKWIEQFELQYKAWKEGREVPLNGTPLEGWPLLMKLQVQQIRAAGVHTVEDLAIANEDALARIGMGGRHYKNLAVKWVEQAKNGVNVKKLADLEAALKTKDEIIDSMKGKMAELESAVAALQGRKKAA